MKFRKTISAIAALAMSVSCLAGLTITANAASTYYLIGSASQAETFTDYTGPGTHETLGSYGSWSNSLNATYSSDPTAFSTTANAFGLATVTGVNTSAAVDSAWSKEDGNYPSFVDGTVLGITARAGGNSYNTNEGIFTIGDGFTLNNGTLTLETDIAWSTNYALQTGTLNFYDNSDNNVASVSISGTGKDGTKPFVITTNATEGNKAEKGGANIRGASLPGAKYKLTIDFENKKFLYEITSAKGGTSGTVEKYTGELPLGSVSAIKKIGFTCTQSGKNNTMSAYLDNTKLYATCELPDTNYTIKYVTDKTSAETIAATTVYSEAGITVNGKAPTTLLKDIVPANKTTDEKKYYVDTAVETGLDDIKVTTNGQEIVVKVRPAIDVDYTVNAALAPVGTAAPEVIKTIKTGKIVEGEKETIGISEYIVKDNVAYKTDAVGNDYFRRTITGGSAATQTENITYAPVENMVAVFFGEAEDLFNNGNDSGAGNANIRCSNGKGADLPTDKADAKVVTTLPAGKYKITSTVWGGGTSSNGGDKNGEYTFLAEGVSTPIFAEKTTGARKTYTSDEFEIKSDAKILAYKTIAGSGVCMDYVLIEKTGEATHDVTVDAKKATIAETDATTGMVGAPTFESIKENYDFENKKIISVTVAAPTAEDKATIPVVKIGDTEYKLTAEEWTAVSDADGLSYYMEFVKRADADWATFGDVTVTFGTGESATTKKIDLTA